jgi:hypothetical protein
VRRTFVVLVLAASVSTSAQAQRAWQTEFGIQGGFTRLVQAGSGGDPADVVSLPGFNLGPALAGPAGLYVIIPWNNKLAVETEAAASQITAGGAATLLALGVRGNYAFSDRFYAAAGGALSYSNGLIANETQLGLHVAVGYRRPLTGPLNGRLEVRTMLWGKTENIPPQNAYSVLIGVSTATSSGRAARSAAPRTRAARAWAPQLGVAGGYVNIHQVGAGDITALALPSYGGGLGSLLGTPEAVLPPTMFLIIPIGDKIALEPGLDIHRFQATTGPGITDFSGNLSGRLNYAVHGGWYGALGGNLHYIKSSGTDAVTRTGLNLAWGYRFALTGPLGGRMEANYTMFGAKSSATPAIAPLNTLGLMFAVLVPVK